MKKICKNAHLCAKPGKKCSITDFDTEYTGNLKKDDAKKLLDENIKELAKLQDKLYADNRYAVLLIFQAMDAAGKDGTIKHVMTGINPQGCQVFNFKQPSAEELDHDYFWRTYKCLPERGRIGIFNRSYYEEVLVAKVHPEIILKQNLPCVTSADDIDNDFWERRYRQINDIERHLVENGTIIFKFFLNVSKDQQKRRFLRRIEDETRNWKFSMTDVQERRFWDNYMDAYADMLTNTSTEYAPWHVIPADNKWFMRFAVGKIIVERLSELDIQYPKVDDDGRKKLQEEKEMLLNNKDA